MFLSSSTVSTIELHNLLLERNLVTLFEFRLYCNTICKMILINFDVIFRFLSTLAATKKATLKWYHHVEVRYHFTATRQDVDLLGSMEFYPRLEGGGWQRWMSGCCEYVVICPGWGLMGLLCKFACYTTLIIINVSNKFLIKNKVKCANNMSNNCVHVSYAFFIYHIITIISKIEIFFFYSLITIDTYIW